MWSETEIVPEVEGTIDYAQSQKEKGNVEQSWLTLSYCALLALFVRSYMKRDR